jgi:hypothetical protein
MSLDLVVLTRGSAPDYEQALRVAAGTAEGEPDAERTAAFAEELERWVGEGDWPFTGDPIVAPTHVDLVVAHEAWVRVVPTIVEIAHRHDLVVVDPQRERLFPPGSAYVDDARDEASEPARLRIEATVHRADGSRDDVGVIYDSSRLGRLSPRRLLARMRLRRMAP